MFTDPSTRTAVFPLPSWRRGGAAVFLLKIPYIPKESLDESLMSRWSLEISSTICFFVRNRDSGISSRKVSSTKVGVESVREEQVRDMQRGPDHPEGKQISR